MRRALVIVLAVVVLGGAMVVLWFASHRPATEIVFRWNHAEGSRDLLCSGAVIKSCACGFTLTDKTAGAVVSAAIGPGERSYVYRPAGGIRVGYEHRFTLVADAVDAAGKPIHSVPAVVVIRYTWWSSLRKRGVQAR
jgi:hypothetical protein